MAGLYLALALAVFAISLRILAAVRHEQRVAPRARWSLTIYYPGDLPKAGDVLDAVLGIIRPALARRRRATTRTNA